MNKLPVFSTLGSAITFPFREISAVVRLTWLPMLILTGAYVYFMREYLAFMPAMMQSLQNPGSPPQFPVQFLMTELIFFGVYLVINAVVAAALLRVIIFDDRRPGALVYFGFGKVELFLILMPIAFVLIIVIYAVLFSVIVGIVGAGLMAALPPDIGPYVLGALPVAFVLFLIWFVIRMILWSPTIVAEKKFSLLNAARVTAGNFWRLLGLIILFGIVIGILQLVVFGVVGAVFGSAMPAIPIPEPGASPQDTERAMMAMMETFARIVQENIYIIAPIIYVLFIIATAWNMALIGYAYKNIKGVSGPSAAEQF